MSDRRVDDPEELVKPGDEVNVVIKEIDHLNNRISLSMRDFERNEERRAVSGYLAKDDESPGFTLGAMVDFDRRKDGE
jgi:small subunit ribosomal protein S1